MKRLGDGANALQGAAQEASQVAHAARMGQGEALEGSIVGARHDPGLVGSARGKRTEGDEISAHLDDALSGIHLLGDDVTKNAALLLLEVIEGGAQLVQDAARNK